MCSTPAISTSGYLVDCEVGDVQMSWFNGSICCAYASSENSQKHCRVFLNAVLAAYSKSNCFKLTHFGAEFLEYCL